MENKKYILNDSNVVLNPCIVWEYIPKNYLAWCYWEIRVGICKNNLWDFGFTKPGGSSPVSIGKYKTKDEAIKNSINYFNEHFRNPNYTDLYKKQHFYAAKTVFINFVNTYKINVSDIVLDKEFNAFNGEQFTLF